MKKYFFITVSMLLILTACKKEVGVISVSQNNGIDLTWLRYPLDTIPVSAGGEIRSYPYSSYVSVPDINVYQSSPTSPVTYSGVTYYGGPFQSCTYTINGTTISFKMKRTDGYSFPVNSIIKIKLNNAGGTIKNSKTLTVASTTCTLSISESNTWNLSGGGSSNPNNVDSYVATWYNPTSGLTFYTQAIKIVAVPTGWGANLGNLQGVSVYSNGFGGFSSTNYLRDASCNNSQKYQCVHFIQKYYLIIKGKNIGNANAGDYWNYYTSHNLTQRINNGAGIPQQGDIICFYKSSTEYHVGIVNGVSSPGKLRVFQENVGMTPVNGNYCSAFKEFNFTSNGSGYNVSASMLGTSWTTLGWVR